MLLTIKSIVELFASRGSAWYGREPVSQLAHALQCAMLAQEAGASPELVSASLMHDLGHLVADRHDRIGAHADDRHEQVAACLLRERFPPAVVEPVRLHVDAKRYLCATDSGYWSSLSDASKRSLELQGGAFTTQEAERFAALTYAADAVRLRGWNDEAKISERPTPSLHYFARVLERCAR